MSSMGGPVGQGATATPWNPNNLPTTQEVQGRVVSTDVKGELVKPKELKAEQWTLANPHGAFGTKRI